MKYTVSYPKRGDKKVVSFFAIFPVSVGFEYRWLERVTIEKIYIEVQRPGQSYWANNKFIDN